MLLNMNGRAQPFTRCTLVQDICRIVVVFFLVYKCGSIFAHLCGYVVFLVYKCGSIFAHLCGYVVFLVYKCGSIFAHLCGYVVFLVYKCGSIFAHLCGYVVFLVYKCGSIFAHLCGYVVFLVYQIVVLHLLIHVVKQFCFVLFSKVVLFHFKQNIIIIFYCAMNLMFENTKLNGLPFHCYTRSLLPRSTCLRGANILCYFFQTIRRLDFLNFCA